MAEINVDWARWIRSSVYVHVEASMQASIPGLQVVVSPEPEQDHGSRQEWCEVRMDGPDYDVYPSNEWGLMVEINILVSSLIGDNDIYALDRLKGAAQKALSGTIDITKRGDGPGDNGDHVGCLRLDDLFTRDFGRVEAATALHQATIEVRGFTEITV